jgi:carbon monoxide dehydrogenase subunit G
MELNGEVLVGADRQRVWSALNDVQMLQACIPGCEEVREESATVRRARVMIKLGPVRARFTGQVTLSDIDPAKGCVMVFDGSGGAAGMASGRARIELSDGDDPYAPTTRIAYAVSASVGGKLGQVGGRLIDASAKQLADQFFVALQSRLAPGVEAPSTRAATDSVTAKPKSMNPAQTPKADPVTISGTGDATRMLWFMLGVVATSIGFWLGAALF